MGRCATTLEAEMTVREHELLLDLIRREKLPGRHLEIGTAAGGTLCSMMGAFDPANRPSFVVVDSMQYFPGQLDAVRRNLREHGLDPGQVDFRVATSVRAFREAAGREESFDFILIDATHRILAVTADLCWSRLLRPGGLLCLHDYCDRFPGVRVPVDRFLARQPNYEILGRADSLLALRKTGPSVRQEVSPLDRAYSWMWYVPLEAQRKAEKWTRRWKAA
jgi:SAM-dependent methyltransferase